MSNVTWIGAASGDWNDPKNWSSKTVPGQNDTVIVNKGSVLNINSSISAQKIENDGGTITFSSGASANNITLNVNSGTTTVASSKIQFSQANVTSASGTLVISGLTNYSVSNLNVSGGTFELDHSSLSGFNGSNVKSGGQIVLNNGSSMTVSNLQSKVTVNGGSTISLDGNYNSGSSVVSGTGTGNTILISSSAAQTNLPISGISKGDMIGVNGSTVDKATYTNSKGSGSVVLTVGNTTYSYNSVSYDATVLEGTTVATGTQDGNAIICFLSGSMIRTPKGDVAVEDIQIGDQVITFDWRNNADIVRPVVWVGKARATVRPELHDDEAGWPVRILKDAIADGVPYKDMLITAEHCLFFKDCFVPVRMLVNGMSIFYDKSITSYDYYHVETEQHSIITADGMLTESYLDTGNRSSFRQEGKVATLRGAVKSWADDAGAPLGVARSFVEPLFRALEWRENSVVGIQIPSETMELTDDPDLHLVTDTGATVRPMRKTAHQYSFMLPPDTQSVRIISRASRPSDVIGPFVDDRRHMGVAVADVRLLCAKRQFDITSHLQAEKPEGWYETDWTDCAWTNGDAELPLGDHLSHGKMGILSMTIRAAGPYLQSDQAVSDVQKRSA
ncbi:Hint domain-containing protein [Acetobacter cibinongensis]|uniref:Membrane protein n=1 Tax=Acetobacter cibinongensis TaxID=146475 RepID=A0A1Z5YVC5_9PROT|nr:Hint domain-containing protein [Acetobacter cibinongensis]OUJ02697.1 membrane protein [Acetobacter cibinongensis]